MSTSTKKQARDLQAITAMPYQAAHRAVLEGSEFRASVRSGLNVSDFVTPREIRIWLHVNSGELRCEAGKHWMSPGDDLGQCVGCGVTMAVRYDHNGEAYDDVISEEEFLDRAERVGLYYNWAPPLRMLDGITQADYHRRHFQPTVEPSHDPWGTSATTTSGTSESAPDPWEAAAAAY